MVLAVECSLYVHSYVVTVLVLDVDVCRYNVVEAVAVWVRILVDWYGRAFLRAA